MQHLTRLCAYEFITYAIEHMMEHLISDVIANVYFLKYISHETLYAYIMVSFTSFGSNYSIFIVQLKSRDVEAVLEILLFS